MIMFMQTMKLNLKYFTKSGLQNSKSGNGSVSQSENSWSSPSAPAEAARLPDDWNGAAEEMEGERERGRIDNRGVKKPTFYWIKSRPQAKGGKYSTWVLNTGVVRETSHRKWREIDLQPSCWQQLALPGRCLVYLLFLYGVSFTRQGIIRGFFHRPRWSGFLNIF